MANSSRSFGQLICVWQLVGRCGVSHRSSNGSFEQLSTETLRWRNDRIGISEIDAIEAHHEMEVLPGLDLSGIHWLIAGGESGPRARPVDEEWLVDLRDQCAAAEVPFFFKQWGGRTPKSGGRRLQELTYDGMPGRDIALV